MSGTPAMCAIVTCERLEARRHFSVPAKSLSRSLVPGTLLEYESFHGPDTSGTPGKITSVVGPIKILGGKRTTRLDDVDVFFGNTQRESTYVSLSPSLGYRVHRTDGSATFSGTLVTSITTLTPFSTIFPGQLVAGQTYSYTNVISQKQYTNGVLSATSTPVTDTFTVKLTSEKRRNIIVPYGKLSTFKLLVSHTSLVNGKPYVKNGTMWCSPSIGTVRTMLSVGGVQTSQSQLTNYIPAGAVAATQTLAVKPMTISRSVSVMKSLSSALPRESVLDVLEAAAGRQP
jgi:hypothetical protein